MQEKIEKENHDYWSELCGTAAAVKLLGITDDSVESLKIFDEWYFSFYPYLKKHVPVETFKDKKVLEVGLGYGSVGERIACSEVAEYIGLDIASGPVYMMNHRMQQQKVADKAKAIKGSILDAPFEDEYFDVIVSIGCLHHTGNMQKSIDEVFRMLKPGGKAYIMVYNQFSARQWARWPMDTLAAFYKDIIGNMSYRQTTEKQRAAYDASIDGPAAPETEFFSISRLKYIFKNYSKVEFTKENNDDFILRSKIMISRKNLLSSVGKYFGLDIYIEATK